MEQFRLFSRLYFLFSLCCIFITTSLNATPSLTEGFDWSLPSYATQSDKGGMIGEIGNNDPDVNGIFLEVLWHHSELVEGQYDFSYFQDRLDNSSGKVLVRLEVNSQCHTPSWTTIPFLNSRTLQFWKQEYIDQISGFITNFANQYKANPRIVGVQLGIADGRYSTNTCPDISQYNPNNSADNDELFYTLVFGNGRKGWGEFWLTDNEFNEAEQQSGLTTEIFEDSVINIIDIYLNAFGSQYAHKLALTGFNSFNGGPEYETKMQAIANYAISNGVGGRTGEIESWMRYTHNIYGVDLKTGSSNDSSCYMTFDESFADQIEGRYWGDENEFFGNLNYVFDDVGPLSNQSYRFYVSSMRALQMRRNFFSINDAGNEHLRSVNDEYNSGDFITYLSKTLGRTRADTPDAFVVLGERTLNTGSGLFPSEYKTGNTSEQCLIDGGNRGYVTVREFGRWLSVVNSTAADSTMRKDMPDSENNWGLNMIANRNGEYYELYARKSNEMLFDINDQLMQERCSNGCNIKVKVVFKDDRVMGLQLNHTNGLSDILTTQGNNQIRTATFSVSDIFNNGFNGADFSVKTIDGSDISILMTRINIESQLSGTFLLNESNLNANNIGDTFNYSFESPAGAISLNVSMTNVTGDPDLYVRFGNAPTVNNYDCRPFQTIDTDEICDFNTPQAGTWHVMILADDPFSGVNLQATAISSPPSSNQLLNENNLNANNIGDVFNYSFELPAGATSLNVSITNVTGDPDLYVRFGSAPTVNNYDCRPFQTIDTDEICDFNTPQAGTWHVMILADDPFSSVNLTATSLAQ